MSQQFFYAEFKLQPKRGVVTVSVSKAQEVVLEVPRKLIEDWKRENPERELTDQAIAADIARVVVADAISSFPDLPAYEMVVPTWLEERHPVMNARACDHHDNGIRAWVIKASDDSLATKSSAGANTSERQGPFVSHYCKNVSLDVPRCLSSGLRGRCFCEGHAYLKRLAEVRLHADQTDSGREHRPIDHSGIGFLRV
jgi:hypothetical protein